YTYYSPNPNYFGDDSFAYTIFDGNGGTDIATVNLTVTGVNDPPMAYDDYYSTFEDTTLNVPAPGVLDNDNDLENDTLTAEKLSDPVHGNMTFYSNGSFDFIPDENYVGTDNFTYRAYDGEYYSNTATVNLTITSMNDSPVANNDNYTTEEDTILNVSAPGLLINDTDEENDNLTAILVNGPSNGILTLNSNGSFYYSPDANYYGSDNFTYKANDGFTDSNIATVYINITSVQDPPIAFDDYYITNEDSTLYVSTPGVLANDTDPDNDILTAEKLSDPSYGMLTFDSNGSFNYVPDGNYVGYDSFTYWAYDGSNYSNIATVHINIIQINDPPIANDDTFEVEQDSVDNQFDVLFNDVDFDGDDLTIISVTMPEFGSVTYDGNYVYYTPNQYYIGSDQFEYNITDGTGGFDNAVVDITVRGVNHPPEKPLISGPPSGSANVEYEYAFITNDPDGDDIFYEVMWGDGTFEDWIGPYSSDQAVSVKHTYFGTGIYTIRARAKDTYNETSEWATVDVWMPRSKVMSNSFILRFLERLLHRFPLLSLLGLQFGVYSPKHLNILKLNEYRTGVN
ncbi:MAG: tandem-95 repeat protein, partial [Thermoplasmatales archaeon]|nr:tandem-95 repeat protein [Thermoplasmatales archaeon]